MTLILFRHCEAMWYLKNLTTPTNLKSIKTSQMLMDEKDKRIAELDKDRFAVAFKTSHIFIFLNSYLY